MVKLPPFPDILTVVHAFSLLTWNDCSERDRVGSRTKNRPWPNKGMIAVYLSGSFEGVSAATRVAMLVVEAGRNASGRQNKTLGASFHWCAEKRFLSVFISFLRKTSDRVIVPNTSRSDMQSLTIRLSDLEDVH